MEHLLEQKVNNFVNWITPIVKRGTNKPMVNSRLGYLDNLKRMPSLAILIGGIIARHKQGGTFEKYVKGQQDEIGISFTPEEDARFRLYCDFLQEVSEAAMKRKVDGTINAQTITFDEVK